MKILDALPYSATATSETVRAETARIKPYQIIVWVSIGLQQIVEWDPRSPRLPAVLDTGNNHNLSIGRSHLVRWAGIQPASLRRLGTIRERGKQFPLYAARLWLHPNVPERREPSGAEPLSLRVEDGIAVYPDEDAPRLPVLGLRVLTANRLQTTIDGGTRQVTIRTPRRFRLFG
jgi:hypothetical protein